MGLISLRTLIDGWKNNGDTVMIPLLQRNYKWKSGADSPEKNTAAGLIHDILDSFRKGAGDPQPYIIGLITAYRAPGGKEIQIIDGQQRFITLSLIVKALDGRIDSFSAFDEWIRLIFERDDKTGQRERYIYDDQSSGSVDVARMKANYKAISACLDLNKNKNGDVSYEELFGYILDHVMVMYRETDNEPLDEFLNMNFNKIKFCAADYVKTYMLLESGSSGDITREDILSLWSRIQYRLFSLESRYCVKNSSSDTLTNDMFELISRNYSNYNINRIELLFEDKYYENYKNMRDVLGEYSKVDPSPLEAEYSRLEHCDRIMDELLKELSVTIGGKTHPNYTAYNAYELLCRKRSDVHFFKLFQDEQRVSLNVLKDQFSLTQKSEEKNRACAELDDLNQFVEAVMESDLYSSNDSSLKKMNLVLAKRLVGVSTNIDKLYFAQYYQKFRNVFDEYIDIVRSAQDFGNSQPVNESAAADVSDEGADTTCLKGISTIEDLFGCGEIRQIIVPCIQRDYVMGSYADPKSSGRGYIEAFLSKIRFLEMRTMLSQADGLEDSVINELCSGYNIRTENFRDKLLEHVFPADREINGNLFDDRLWNGYLIHSKDQIKWWHADDALKELGFTGDTYSTRMTLGSYVTLCKDGSVDMRNHSYPDRCENLFSKLRRKVEDRLEAKGAADCSDPEKISMMNFSCISGYLDKDGRFWVYDGQQRLSTVVVMLAASLVGNYDQHIYDLLKKFSFDRRENANKMLIVIREYAKNKKKEVPEFLKDLKQWITDQTCLSIYLLFSRLVPSTDSKNRESKVWAEIQKISSDYLLKGLRFELVSMDRIADSEQLFIELNDGEKLEGYEEYKAKFSSLLGKELPDRQKEIMRKVDNEWLDRWGTEQEEFKWIQYCMKYAYFEIKGYSENRKNNELDGVDDSVIILAEKIIDGMYDKDKKRDISTWIETLEYPSAETSCYSGEIRFSRDDFKRLIKMLEKCGCLKNAFEYIHQHRENKCVRIPESDNDAAGNQEAGSSGKKGDFADNGELLLRCFQNRYRMAVYMNSSQDNPPWQSEKKDKKPTSVVNLGTVFEDTAQTADECLLNSNEVQKLLESLFYSQGDVPVSDVRVTLTRNVTGASLIKRGALPAGSDYFLNGEKKIKIDKIEDISDSEKYLESTEKTFYDVVNDPRYAEYIPEFLVRKGLTALAFPLSGVLSDDAMYMNWHNSYSLHKPFRPDIKPTNSAKECWHHILHTLRELVDNCDDVVREDILKHALWIADGLSGVDPKCVEKQDRDWLRFTVQNYLHEIADDPKCVEKKDRDWLRFTVQNYLHKIADDPKDSAFMNDYLKERMDRACKTNHGVIPDMGWEFRSLFPAEAYLNILSAVTGVGANFAYAERDRYIRECGFGGFGDENLITEYDRFFDLYIQFNKLAKT